MPLDAILIPFLFAFGACVGSFLNVVVYRLGSLEDVPGEGYLAQLIRQIKRLSYPPSTCPICGRRLAWSDNIPVLGWVLLRGRCRYCRLPISPRYPIVEAITGGLFVFYYVMIFVYGWGPCGPAIAKRDIFGIETLSTATMVLGRDWPIFLMALYLIGSLLAASLIDAATYHIPLWVCWLAGIFGVATHAFDGRGLPGNLIVELPAAAMAGGGITGLILSIVLLRLGVLRQSFSEGATPLEIEREALGADAEVLHLTPAQVRAEMRLEMLFLMPPLVLAGAAAVAAMLWGEGLILPTPIGGMAGAVLGAMAGGLVVWLTRILGSYGFGREAMGLGDVHLMLAVGACLGGGAAVVSFFLAPFFGLATALFMLLTGGRRELPYGPYLSLAAGFVLLFYCPIADYLRPGVLGLGAALQMLLGLGP